MASLVLFKQSDKLVVLVGVEFRGHLVASWDGLEDIVVLFHKLDGRLVVVLQTAQQPSLSCYLPVPVQVIYDEFSVLRAIIVQPVLAASHQGFVYLLVHLNRLDSEVTYGLLKVDGLPDEIDGEVRVVHPRPQLLLFDLTPVWLS